MKPSKFSVIQAEMRIVYGLDADGDVAAAVTYEADGVEDTVPDFFMGLTMLKIAEIDFLHRRGILHQHEE